MKNMKNYHYLHLKVDVLLLAGVFKAFKTESKNSFKLDLARYSATPGHSGM